MRKLEYLSPTSVSKWNQDPEQFYIHYLTENRKPRDPQTQAMSVGSAFDAYVKSYLHEHLFGKGADPRFARDAIFEDQVEPHNRDFARTAGEHLLVTYKKLGSLDDLLVSLGRSKGPPRFELDLIGKKSLGRNGVIRDLPIRVKPDLCFVNEHDAVVVLDWKVNGYCSKSGISPNQGFVKARRQGKVDAWAHKDAKLSVTKGLLISTTPLEQLSEEWGRQISFGAWLFGQDIGAPFLGMVHQLACRPNQVTCAEFCAHVSKEFQEASFDQAHALWEAINSDHVFRNMSKSDSAALCALLDERGSNTEDALCPGLES